MARSTFTLLVSLGLISALAFSGCKKKEKNPLFVNNGNGSGFGDVPGDGSSSDTDMTWPDDDPYFNDGNETDNPGANDDSPNSNGTNPTGTTGTNPSGVGPTNGNGNGSTGASSANRADVVVVSGNQELTFLSHIFPHLVQGQTSRVTFLVKNRGNVATARPSFHFRGDNDGFQLSEYTCGAAIAPAATCVIGITFVAAAARTYQADALYEYDDALGGRGHLLFTLVGSADSRASLVVDPDAIDFGTHFTGADLERFFTIRNVGALEAHVGFAGVSAPMSLEGLEGLQTGPNQYTIPAGAVRQVRLRYRPTEVGIHNQVMLFAYTDESAPTDEIHLEVPVRGRAIKAILSVAKGASPTDDADVAIFNPFNFQQTFAHFQAYPDAHKGGSSVASCDIDGDGYPEVITGAGPNGLPQVVVYKGNATDRSFTNPSSWMTRFLAYASAFRGGVSVACGDINGDGTPDIITGAGPGGGPHVTVVDGTKLSGEWELGSSSSNGRYLRSFFAYHNEFAGGVWVAAGDVNGDGRVDIVTGAGETGGPHVMAFDGNYVDMGFSEPGSQLASFFAYEPDFRGGVFVATGDVNNDGRDEIITGSGPGGVPRVIAYDWRLGPSIAQPTSMWLNFLAYDVSFLGGVRVSSFDQNRDDKRDIITGAGPTGGPHIKIFNAAQNGTSELLSDFAFDPNFTGGIFVGAPR